jgi:hypothetical protein
VDYSRFFHDGSRVLCIGDNHSMAATKEEFMRSLPELKINGVSQVGFELLPSDAKTQSKIQDYFNLRKEGSDPKTLHDAREEFKNLFIDGKPE